MLALERVIQTEDKLQKLVHANADLPPRLRICIGGFRFDLNCLETDFKSILTYHPRAVDHLRMCLATGFINGMVYRALPTEPVCLIGTIARVEGVRDLGDILELSFAALDNFKDAYPPYDGHVSPSEFMFRYIRQNGTPERNPLTRLFLGWIASL